jgi:hypothetical protein
MFSIKAEVNYPVKIASLGQIFQFHRDLLAS